jgi:hypothetical protein
MLALVVVKLFIVINMNIVDIFNDWLSGDKKSSEQTTVVQQPVVKPVETPKQSGYADRVAFIESSNNPKAKSKTSSAAGLFQFTDGTWNEYVSKMGKNYSLEDRFDAVKAREVFDYKTDDEAKRLAKVLKRDVNDTEKYLAHFMGVQGAVKFLKSSPMARVDKVATSSALKANKSIFYDDKGKVKRVSDVYSYFNNKLNE